MPSIIPSPKPKIAPKLVSIDASTSDETSDIESIYRKLKHREHVLELPDTYIGSVNSKQVSLYLLNDEHSQMTRQTVDIVPGLFKIFDEIIVNTRDQFVRMKQIIERQQAIKEGRLPPDPLINLERRYYPVRRMEIDIADDLSEISVKNDGDGLDVAWHNQENMYVPQLIFGSLLTGANFNKGQGRITGGKNGYGAKLANIFSTEFIVETVDAYRKKKYIQRFANNMTITEPPVITSYRGKPYTKITFRPDLQRFHRTSSDRTRDLMIRRVYDLAACTDAYVKVFLNSQELKIRSFERYVDLYIGTRGQTKRVYYRFNDRWEVAVTLSPDREFAQVSLVNGIYTFRGGTHVDRVADILATKMASYAQQKKKGANGLQKRYIKENMWIFLNCTIVEPDFDTQTKEHLTTNVSAKTIHKQPNVNRFQPEWVTEDLVKKLVATPMQIIQHAMSSSEFKNQSKNARQLKSSDGRKTNKVKSDKLLEGSYPGTRKSADCVLILAEGDSAMTSAVSGLTGLSEEQRKYYGVFPLRGKLVNPKEAKLTTIEKNKEFIELKKILGLRQGMDYSRPENLRTLRYGSVWILTDADLDGDHIKGLIFNLFHTYWPSLLKVPGFFKSLLTPILKIKSKKNPREVREFYSEEQFEQWKQQQQEAQGVDITKIWGKAKYYKGLGTHDRIEARKWFTHQKLQVYNWTQADLDLWTASQSPKDPVNKLTSYWTARNEEPTDLAIQLAFSKRKADIRKEWITHYLRLKSRQTLNKMDLYLANSLGYTDFINYKLIQFSVYDCIRNIPSVMDGLKPSQRKILYACFKLKDPFKEIKVAQLAGHVAQVSAYHHGETSLANAIITMAQNYPGSNNINLLYPAGQFGSRKGKGKDHSSPRYIHTYLTSICPLIFPESDRPLLKYLDDDGFPIEPEWYLPVIPMVLVNGVQGIGTGWSTMIPAYSPRDIIANLRRYLQGQPMEPMIPWYRGFRGHIKSDDSQMTSFTVKGLYHRSGPRTLTITEIPVGDSKQTKSYDDYKIFLESLTDEENTKVPTLLEDLDIAITDTTIQAVLTFKDLEVLEDLLTHPDKLEKTLKLRYSLKTSNMYLFNHQGVMTKYASPLEIIQEFAQQRLALYSRRKAYLLDQLNQQLTKISARVRFLQKIIDPEDPFTVNNRPKTAIEADLQSDDFPLVGSPPSYNYLLNQPIWSLTKEKLQQLLKEKNRLEEQINHLQATTEHQMWTTELDQIDQSMSNFIRQWEEIYQGLNGQERPPKIQLKLR